MQVELLKRLHPPKLGPCACSQVRRLARKLSSLYDTLLSPEDLTITQYSLLANIELAGQLRHVLSREGRDGPHHIDAQSTSPDEAHSRTLHRTRNPYRLAQGQGMDLLLSGRPGTVGPCS
jgi:hypothetical protein